MTSRSRFYPTMATVLSGDLADLLVVCERFDLTLGDALAEVIHLGITAYVDKLEALAVMEKDDTPSIVESPHDNATILLNAYRVRMNPISVQADGYLEIATYDSK